MPGVDINAYLPIPVKVLVNKESQRIFILTVKIFLICHGTVIPFHKQKIIDERYTDDILVVAVAVNHQQILFPGNKTGCMHLGKNP